jgi:homoserine acetyltransferase
MSNANKRLESVDLEALDAAVGGGVGDWLGSLFGYGAPAGVGEAVGAMQPAARAMAIAPQGRNRNALIRDMATNGGNYSEANFSRYNNGKAAQLSRAVGRW